MMKKIISVSVLAVGVMLSSQALAGTGRLLTSGDVTALQCVALSNDVTIQLSNKVTAAWGCNAIQFSAATCHINGTNKSQTLPCSYTKNTAEDGSVSWTANSSQCPAYDGTGDAPSASFTFVGRVGFTGGSGGGSVTSAELPVAACDADGAAAASLIPTNLGY